MSEELNLHGTTDVVVWAKEFCRLFPDADEGLMLGWFANAIMAGVDSVPRAPAWQDISTAPKDGRHAELIQAFVAGASAMQRQAAEGVRDWMAFTKYAQERISDEMADEIIAIDISSLILADDATPLTDEAPQSGEGE